MATSISMNVLFSLSRIIISGLLLLLLLLLCGSGSRDSAVGVATYYGLDNPDFESRLRQEIFICYKTAQAGPLHLLFDGHRGSFLAVKRLHLVLRLRIRGFTPLFPVNAYKTWTGRTLSELCRNHFFMQCTSFLTDIFVNAGQITG